MQQQKNFLLFLILSTGIMIGSFWLFAPKPRQPESSKSKPELPLKLPDPRLWAGLPPQAAAPGAGNALALLSDLAVTSFSTGQRLRWEKPEPPPQVAKKAEEPAKPVAWVPLGDNASHDARFNLHVLLDPRGASVHRVILNRFQKADAFGRPEWADPGKKVPVPLELVPPDRFGGQGSNVLYHYANPDKADERPVDTLGKILWKVAKESFTDDEHKVVFEATVQDVIVTKTYTLRPGDYHVGLEVGLRLRPGADPRKFRYQLAAAHGLPIEGEWYTGTTRNAVIGRVDDGGGAWRTLEDLRDISHKWGGDLVRSEEDGKPRPIRYAGVAIQFFASLVVVDNEQPDQNFLAWARPTLETQVIKSKVKASGLDPLLRKGPLQPGDVFTIEGYKPQETFDILIGWGAHVPANPIAPGQNLTLICTTDSKDRLVAHEVYTEAETDRVFNDDITVRVTTQLLDLRPDKGVVHKYLLYNGPVKVMLLGQLKGPAKVDPGLVERYKDTLHLNTLTDYRSNGFFGAVAEKIGWTFLLIKCTNLMHHVLYFLHTTLFDLKWGVCIILLTVLVRLLMFPVSKKQALTGIKMQQLAPELKKLQAKYAGNRQELGMATMALYRKHGVNPFGTCWLILLQMPIFMGLYFALQESIHFRLAPFLGWIVNLAAPDMLLSWGQSIPWISTPTSHGGLLYLGPYLNVLPILAVALMLIQQKVTMPPPTDDQQAAQQRMFKIMLIFMAVLFYKVAAGLCVYFIASTLWALAERKLLPKHLLASAASAAEGDDRPGFMQRLKERLDATRKDGELADAGNGSITAQPPGARRGSPDAAAPERKPGRGKRKPGRGKPAASEPPGKVGGWLSKVREWWSELLKKAEKK
jgi:YidC/Oxa1 family membrane protein insertase